MERPRNIPMILSHRVSRRAPVIDAALVFALLLPRLARADDAVAESLYQEGRHAAEAKDWDLACKKFRESQDREPAPGTLLNLADCEDKRGHLIEALADFEASAKLLQDSRRTYAKERAAALGRRLPRLTLRLPSRIPTATSVERDGRLVEAASLGTPVALDPGEHVVVVRAQGHAEAKRTLRLAEGQSLSVELAVGAPLTDGSKEAVVPATEGPSTSDASAPIPTPSRLPRSASAMRTAGIASLGVGAAGLAVGLVTGLLTLNAKSTADAACPAAGCTPEGLDAQDRGKRWSTVSTVGFATAGVGLLAGASLLLLAPRHASVDRSLASRLTLASTPVAGGSVLGLAGRF